MRVSTEQGFVWKSSVSSAILVVGSFVGKVLGSCCASLCDAAEFLVAETKRTRIEGVRNL